MPRFRLPDPKDRSCNEPSTIASSTQVLGLYNQENPEDKKERVVDSVKTWYKDIALQGGWHKASFTGGQCHLTANVKLEPKPKP